MNKGILLMAAALTLSATAMAAPTLPDVATPYYLMHSSGNHLAKNADGKAVLEAPDATAPQMLTFTPAEDGYYTISAPDNGGFLQLTGSYNTTFGANGTTNNAKYRIEAVGSSYIVLKCRANNKYLGTDQNDACSSVFSDKSGGDSRHYWYLSTDPKAAPAPDEMSYVINPAARRQHFDGWGVSLCWWANMAGKWSDEKIDEIVDWLVSPEGLNFRIFRYNIGGGDDPENKNCTEHHMGSGKGLRAEMEGFKDSSDGEYIWSRDEAQRKIMLKIKEKRPDAIFEAFSNSAPWYMTYSGCVAGNSPASKDNLKPEFYEEFAHYLVDVCKHYKDVYGIEFKTLDPFNEPMTSYWGKNGGQEGCHFDVQSMIAFLKVLYPILKESGLNTVISAADETDVNQSVKDFIAFRDAGVLEYIGQWNTHTYSASDNSRCQISALCAQEKMPLWQSETGAGGTGIAGNLGMAQKLINDVRFIAPSAWLDWQYIEENNDQWCLVQSGSFAEGTYHKVKNYYIRSQFSRFIKEGSTFLTSLNNKSLAAMNPAGDHLVIVAINSGAMEAIHNVDLSMFSTVGSDIEAYITNPTENVAPFAGYSLDKDVFRFTLPAQSVATFIIPASYDGKTGTEPVSGTDYILCPRNAAGLALNAIDGDVTIKDITFDKSQLWKLETSGEGFTLTNRNGEILSRNGDEYALTTKKEAADGQAFLIEALDQLYFKITDTEGVKGLDIEGESNSSGAHVGVWAYDAAAPVHRQWMILGVPEKWLNDGVELVSTPEERSPLHITTPAEGILRIAIADGRCGELGVYAPSGMQVFLRAEASGEIEVPVVPGVYIVGFTDNCGAARSARTVCVR